MEETDILMKDGECSKVATYFIIYLLIGSRSVDFYYYDRIIWTEPDTTVSPTKIMVPKMTTIEFIYSFFLLTIVGQVCEV